MDTRRHAPDASTRTGSAQRSAEHRTSHAREALRLVLAPPKARPGKMKKLNSTTSGSLGSFDRRLYQRQQRSQLEQKSRDRPISKRPHIRRLRTYTKIILRNSQ